MAKATIKSNTGATITIEGSPEEVSKIVSDFESKSSSHQLKATSDKRTVKKRDDKKRRTASDLIVELREEGFFDKPKSLAEIAEALENKAHLYPVTTLSGVLIGLVQKKLLGRKKLDKKWVYGKLQ